MLLAVKSLGEYLIKKEDKDKIEVFLQKAKIGKTLKTIILVFDKIDDTISYSKIYIEDYSEVKSLKYLYRMFRHARYDLVLTSKFSSIEKFYKRWILWFKNFLETYKDNVFLHELSREFEESKERILDNLKEKYTELSTDEKKNSIITIKISEKGKEKYIGELEFFKNLFRVETEKKFYSKYNKEAKADGVCILCKNEREIYGYASPFSFYTVDKRGFAPQFQQENAWKLLPVCSDCGIALTAGKEFLDTYLFKKFYGFNFYVIPKLIFGEIPKDLIEDIKDVGNREDLMNILEEEDEILDLMKERENFINLIFVFCQRKQQDYIDILKYVEGVPPSWIKNIYVTFYDISIRKSIFREETLQMIFGKNWTSDFVEGTWKGKRLKKLNLGGMIRSFFPFSKETGVYNKYLLDIIGDILAERAINEKILINAFMREIRNQFVNNNQWSVTFLILKSLYVYTFLKELKLIKNGGNFMSNNKSKLDKSNKLEAYFSEHQEAFDTPVKKALFSEGVLAKFLLDIQLVKRNAVPFRSKLYGLKLDERRIKKLLPEIIDKLRQYDRGYPWLEQLISEYMIKADKLGWRLSKDEISYYFTLGLSLGKLFKKKEESEKVNE